MHSFIALLDREPLSNDRIAQHRGGLHEPAIPSFDIGKIRRWLEPS
ncbi:hypothetical protein [Synechococcus sp. M16CYN]